LRPWIKFEKGAYELFEVCNDMRAGYVRVLRSMSDVIEEHGDGNALELRDSQNPGALTHLSTWLLVNKEAHPGLVELLNGIKGACLIRLLIKPLGDSEFEMKIYNGTKINDFLKHLAEFIGQDVKKMKVRAVDQAQIRRIDNKTWNKHTKSENTLKDLDINDNSSILVESRAPGE
jgi:hypothetical protein